MNKTFTSLQRPTYPMPDFIKQALEEKGLLAKYHERPPYQQNDYVGWIIRAIHPETQKKRLHQMLDEVESGGVYMKMSWKPAR